MWKKIVVLLVGIIIAISLFLFYQVNQFQHKIQAELDRRQIYTSAINVSFFPQLRIVLNQVKYQQLSADKIALNFQFLDLFSGNLVPYQTDFAQFKLSEKAENSAHIRLNSAGIHVKSNHEVELANINLDAVFAHPLYGKVQKLNLNFAKATIQLTAPNQYHLIADDLNINQQYVGYFELNADLNKPQQISALFSQGQFKYQQINSDIANIQLTGGEFPIEKLLTIFQFPNPLTGKADFNITLQLHHSKIMQGEFNLVAHHGELQGLNLLALAAQYLPINYDEQQLSEKNINTKYDELLTQFTLEQDHLNVKNIQIKLPALLLQGQGNVNLQNMQCDINMTLRSTNEDYSALALPIHFFDNCYSPQYKVKFNKDFRNQLKEFIREKLR